MDGRTAANLSVEQLTTIIDTLNEGVSLSDAEGKIFRINPSLCRVTGLPAEAFLDKPMMSLYEAGYFQKIPISYGALTERKVKQGIQLISTGKSVLASATPVLDSAGSPLYVVVIGSDLRDLKGLESALQGIQKGDNELSSSLIETIENGIYGTRLIARSKGMIFALKQALIVAPTDVTVLILGESGVGKNLLAEIIHKASHRSDKGPIVYLDCNSISKNLVDSELFGYEKGTFTGALTTGKPGILEMATGGTLFLDEISDLPFEIQGKFLRFLESHSFRRLGGNKVIEADVRIIAATNKDLRAMVNNGEFRSDLFYRLNAAHIFIPPLRARAEDIVALTGYYLDLFNKKYTRCRYLSDKSLQVLQSYEWPGNVRELMNLLERTILFATKDMILPEHMAFIPQSSGSCNEDVIAPHLRNSLEQLEKNLLEGAKLEFGSSRKMGKALGLSHTAVQKKLRKYGML